MINAQIADLSSHNTKYTSPALTQKVFANMRRVGKGFSGVDTLLFDGMLVSQQVHDDVPDAAKEVGKEEKAKSFRVKKIEEGGIAELDADEDVTLEEVDIEVQERLLESQVQVYHLDLEHAQKVLSMQETDKAEPAEVEEVLKVVTAAKLMTKVVTTATTTITDAPVPKASTPRRRRGVIIHDPEEAANASLKQVKRKERQDNTVMRYHALKRKPVTEAHARKNMMVYLKNMVGYKMDFFKGMTYIEIRPIFKKHFNSIWAFLKKGEKEIEEEDGKRKSENLKQKAVKKQKIDEEVEELKTHLQIVPNDEDDVYNKATPIALKVPVVDYQIHTEHNKPYFKIIRADGTYELFLSFISLLRSFDREDLEMLWEIVQERFESSVPKNFSDDFLLYALKTMFEKPNVEANIWKNQRGRYRLAKVKSWKLLESCRVYIITFTTTQMILLVERRYPLT
nr:hypothetical protein [Tanacetum cinerariifolium]